MITILCISAYLWNNRRKTQSSISSQLSPDCPLQISTEVLKAQKKHRKTHRGTNFKRSQNYPSEITVKVSLRLPGKYFHAGPWTADILSISCWMKINIPLPCSTLTFSLLLSAGLVLMSSSTIEKIEFVNEYFKYICPLDISISYFRLLH